MTPTRNPKLTVLTAVYNGERYLEQCIASILSQDFTDFEYVIVDDGSIDGTAELLERRAARDPRIVIERIPHNAGVSAALNRGLAIARGEYIGKQDSDDICAAGRLRAQVEALDREADVMLVSATYRMIDRHGRWAGNGRAACPPGLVSYMMNFSNADPGGGCLGMFRRDIAREIGGFREDLIASIDYDFAARLLKRGRLLVLPIVGTNKRIHPEQVSRRLNAGQRRHSLANSRRLLTSYLQRDLSDEEFYAMSSVWRRFGLVGVADTAHRVMSEAYARLAAAEPDRRTRRQARRLTAGRWALSACDLLQQREFAEAARQFYYSFRWHPLGFVTAIAALIERLQLRVYRRIRPSPSGLDL